MSKFNIPGYGILGFAFGLASLGYALYQDHKHSKLEQDVRDKINLSMENIANKATIDINDQIIGRTVERIVKNKVNTAATEAVNSIKKTLDAINGNTNQSNSTSRTISFNV